MRSDTEGILGAGKHTLSLRTFSDTTRLCDHVVACFREAAHAHDAKARRIFLTFAIVGGDFVGCQLAGELAGRLILYVEGLGFYVARCVLLC